MSVPVSEASPKQLAVSSSHGALHVNLNMSMFVERFKGSSRIIPSPPTPASRHLTWVETNALEEVQFQKYTSQSALGNDELPFKFDGCITSNIIRGPPLQTNLPSPTIFKCLIRFPEPTCGGFRQVQPLIQFLSNPNVGLGGHVADISVNRYFWGSDLRDQQKTHQLLQASVVLSATICHCYSDHVFFVPRCSSSFSVKASCTCPPRITKTWTHKIWSDTPHP